MLPVLLNIGFTIQYNLMDVAYFFVITQSLKKASN